MCNRLKGCVRVDDHPSFCTTSPDIAAREDKTPQRIWVVYDKNTETLHFTSPKMANALAVQQDFEQLAPHRTWVCEMLVLVNGHYVKNPVLAKLSEDLSKREISGSEGTRS